MKRKVEKMKISINHVQSQMPVAVWFGEIKNGFVYRNGNIDLEYSKKHYNYHWELRQKAKRG